MPELDKMKGSSLQNIAQLITERIGLNIDSVRDYQAVSDRVNALKLTSPGDYRRLLGEDSHKSRNEWKVLAEKLTVGESKFFRDEGQFSLLRDRILPELIAKNKTSRSLRMWSAGCSSGEEPYTLAIVINELLADRDKWNISIIGTDLNPQVIERARRGVFSRWSVRSVNPGVMSRYFRMTSAGWEIDSRIREMVSFREGNLLQDSFPTNSSDLHHMDLILCRNVFIYFDRHAVTRVLRKFEDTLTDNGYLMTGHGDLYDQQVAQLQCMTFDKSIVFQRTNVVQPDPLCADQRDNIARRIAVFFRLPRSSQSTGPMAKI